MKPKKLIKKLVLNKTTVSNLEVHEEGAIRGGYLNTNLEATCYTWCGACLTKASCVATCNYSCYCNTINHYTCPQYPTCQSGATCP